MMLQVALAGKLVPSFPCGMKRIKIEASTCSIDAKVTLPRFY